MWGLAQWRHLRCSMMMSCLTPKDDSYLLWTLDRTSQVADTVSYMSANQGTRSPTQYVHPLKDCRYFYKAFQICCTVAHSFSRPRWPLNALYSINHLNVTVLYFVSLLIYDLITGNKYDFTWTYQNSEGFPIRHDATPPSSYVTVTSTGQTYCLGSVIL